MGGQARKMEQGVARILDRCAAMLVDGGSRFRRCFLCCLMLCCLALSASLLPYSMPC